VQLSGVCVTFESVVFESNAAGCVGAGCGGSHDGLVVASGGGASIMIEAPIVTDTSITINNCELFSNAAVSSGIDDSVFCVIVCGRDMHICSWCVQTQT
jgi:hypothetical protein